MSDKYSNRKSCAQVSRTPKPVTPLRGGTARALPAPDWGQPADWNKWAYMLTVEVWRAVALSLDIEPDFLSGLDFRPIIGGPFDDCPSEFKRRLDIASNHVENGQLQCPAPSSIGQYSTVGLADFGEWASSLGWSLPDPFPRRAVSVAASSAGNSDSAGAPTDAPTRAAGTIETVARRLVRPIPIPTAIETLADRLGATNEQAWAEMKSKTVYGRLSLAGIDDKGRLCNLEPHWISYIVPWGVEDPPPDCASTVIGALAPPVRQHPATSDMPRHNSGGFIAFDRERAIRDWRADKSDGRASRSIPPLRIRDVVVDGAQLDDLWARAEYEFQNLDWSLGNVLSWIAYRDPLLICKFES